MARFTRWSVLIVVLLGAWWLRIHALESLPHGVSSDEAVNVVDAFHIGRTANIPFYEDLGRPEPLYRTTLAFVGRWINESVWGYRWVSACLSMIAVASVAWLGRESVGELRPNARHAAALGAAIALSVMVGHLTLSRSLYRGTLMIALVALSAATLLTAIRTGKPRLYIIGGLFTGLSLYTYTAVWVYPLGLVAMGGGLLLTRWRTLRDWLPKLVLAAALALIVATPLLWKISQSREAVFGRAGAVQASRTEPREALDALLSQLFEAGDENPQYNAASAPVIPRALQPIFLLGVALALWRLIRQPSAWLLLTLLILFQIPALLSNEINHGLRIAGVFVVIPPLIGLAFGIVVGGLYGAAHRPPPTKTVVGGNLRVPPLILCALLLVGGGWIARDSWRTYSHYYTHPEAYRQWFIHDVELDQNEWFFRTDRQDFAAWVAAQSTPLLIPVEELERPTTRAWLVGAFPRVTATTTEFTLPAGTRLIAPYTLEQGGLMDATRGYALLDSGTITLLPPLSAATHAALNALANDGQRITRTGELAWIGNLATIPDGLTLTFADPLLPPTLPPNQFGDAHLRVIGVAGNPTLEGGQQTYTLTWEAGRSRLPHDYFSYLQVQTQARERISGSDHLILRWLYPTTIWPTGAPVPDAHTLTIPEGLPYGAYRLVTGVYYYPFMTPIAATGSDVVANGATVAWLKIPQPNPPALPDDLIRADGVFGDAFRLLGVVPSMQTDGTTQVQVYWQSLQARPLYDATVFVHWLDARGNILAQSDLRPHDGQYPTFIWDQDERVMSQHPLGEVPAGGVAVRVGMYGFDAAGQAQNLLTADGQSAIRLALP